LEVPAHARAVPLLTRAPLRSLSPVFGRRGRTVARTSRRTESVQRIVVRAFGAICSSSGQPRRRGNRPTATAVRLRNEGIASRAGGVAVRVASPGCASKVVRLARARAFRRGDGTAGSWLRQECEPGLWSTRTAQRVRTNERVEWHPAYGWVLPRRRAARPN